MASYNYYLKDRKAKTNTPIYLLFDDGVNRCKLYIQEKINPKDWNSEKGEARKSYSGYSDFNSKLKKYQLKCEEIHTLLTNGNEFSIDSMKGQFKVYLDKLNDRIKEDLTGEETNFKTLADFATYYIETVETAKSKNTILHNKQTVRILKEYETANKNKKITFDRINLDFYHDFTKYLKEVKEFKVNTIGKHITNIKTFLAEATDRGINTKLDYKSKRFKVTTETVESIYLTEDEIQKIYNHDFSKNKRLERTRDLFIIGCYTGLRFSDFSQLTSANINGELITVKTQKTGDRVVIPLHWTVKNILAKYSETAKGLPRDISNQRMNDYLKEIGCEVKIDEQIHRTYTKDGLKVSTNVPKWELITTHTARRSFATNLYKNGFPTIGIMKITGHRTEKSFMKYIKMSQEENAEKLIQHWQTLNKLRIV